MVIALDNESLMMLRGPTPPSSAFKMWHDLFRTNRTCTDNAAAPPSSAYSPLRRQQDFAINVFEYSSSVLDLKFV